MLGKIKLKLPAWECIDATKLRLRWNPFLKVVYEINRTERGFTLVTADGVYLHCDTLEQAEKKAKSHFLGELISLFS
jgi:hypothetical protein